jgi:tetratricopeptide (TPR) repeat protein
VKTPTTTTTDRRPSPIAIGVLLVLLPVATLTFGGVHHWARVGLTIGAVLAGASLALRGRYQNHKNLLYLCLSGLLVSVFPVIPVSSAVRGFLHGDLAGPVQGVYDLLERPTRPLALDPWSALFGWTEAAALLLLGLGIVAWLTRSGRARILQWVIIATGVSVVVSMGVHTIVGLDSVYGSGIGLGAREGIFPPFVNPNHAGIFCAAVLSVALVRVLDGTFIHRCLALTAVGVLGFGVWASGSRGAVVAAVFGFAVTAASAGGRTVRLLVGAAVGFGALAMAVVEPETAVRGLGEWVAPSVNQMVDAGYVDITTGRLSLWADTLAIVGSSWIVGVGAGGFDQAYRIVRNDPGFTITTHAHNEPLQLVAEHGVIVAALVILIVLYVVRTGIRALGYWSDRPDRQRQIAGFLGGAGALLAAGLISFPFRLHSHAILLIFCLAGVMGLARPQRQGQAIGRKLRLTVVSLAAAALAVLAVVLHGGLDPVARGEQAQKDGEAWFDVARKDVDKSHALKASSAHFERAAVSNLDRRALQWLARVRVAQGELEGADAVLAVAGTIYPTMPWIWRDRARLAQRMGADERARNSWRRMLTQDLPGGVDPVDVIHEALFGGRFESPIEQARAILPERADRYRQAARVMDELGLREESETLFRHALALDPEGVLYFSQALVRWDRFSDAVMLLEPHERSCKGERLYATSLARIGRQADAAESYAKALGVCGAKDWALRVGLTKARLYSGDSRGADVVEKLLEEQPGAHGLRRAWLWVLSKRGRTVDAVRHLEHLKWKGVITPVEEAALERASIGLPFSLPHDEL